MTEFTEDNFLGGKVRLRQPAKGFRAGIDSVMLAASIPAKPGDAVLEAGIGPGVAALCLAARVPGVHITGVEIAPESVVLAEENAAMNDLWESVKVVAGDVTARPMPLADRQFDHAYANPPFFDKAKVISPSDEARAKAHMMAEEKTGLFVDFLIRRTKPGGTITLVQRAENLPIFMALMAERVGALTLFPLWPRAGQAAKLFLLQGIKASKAPPVIASGLVLHEAENGFTAGAEAVLRHGARLTLDGSVPTSKTD